MPYAAGNDRAEDDRVPQPRSLDAACSRGGRCWVSVRCIINSRLVIRTVRSGVSPDKKILRHLQDSKYQDDADNHYERDEDMHTGYIASRPLTDNTRIQVNADDSG